MLARARAERLLAPFVLDALADRPAGRLTGGEQRRLHTAIALVHRPRVVLLDEPTAGADTQTRAAILEAVRGLAARGHRGRLHDPLPARGRGARRRRRAARGRADHRVAGRSPSWSRAHARERARGRRTPTGAWCGGPGASLHGLGDDVVRAEVIRPSLEAAYLALTGPAERRREHRPHRAAAAAPRPGPGGGARRHAARADDAAQRRDAVHAGHRGLPGRRRLRADRARDGVRVRLVRDRRRRLRDLPRARLAHLAAAARRGAERAARCWAASSPCPRALVAAQHVVLFGVRRRVPGPRASKAPGSRSC